MGCACCSCCDPVFPVPKDEAWQATFKVLNLSKKEVSRLYQVFCAIDKDASGEICTMEFLDFLELE